MNQKETSKVVTQETDFVCSDATPKTPCKISTDSTHEVSSNPSLDHPALPAEKNGTLALLHKRSHDIVEEPQQPTIMQLISRCKGQGANKGRNKERTPRKKEKKEDKKEAKNKAATNAIQKEEATGETGKNFVIENGKIILKEEADTMEAIANKMVRAPEERITSSSFSKRNFSEKWTEEETKKFYRALEIFGSDFSMIASLFPARNRNQIKNKFRREERENNNRVDKAMNKHRGKKFLPKQVLVKVHEQIPDEDFKPRSKRLDSAASMDSLDIRIADDLSMMLKNAVLNSQVARSELMRLQKVNSGSSILQSMKMEKEEDSEADRQADFQDICNNKTEVNSSPNVKAIDFPQN